MDIKKKEKVEKTIQKIKENRAKPENKVLRLIDDKLKWAEDEKLKALKLIEGHRQSIQFIQSQVIRLDGAIVTLNDLRENLIKERKHG